MISGWAGYWVDMVDVYLPLVALAPAIAYFQPSSMSADLASVLFIGTFAATMLGRPLGAMLFGHWADRVGRRRLTLLSIAGFSSCTLAIGLLPGYVAWGVAAPVLLLALRFVNGVFLGGEYTAGTPLAFEHCPPRARGLLGGLMLGAYTLAYVFISLVVLGVLQLAPAGGPSSAYVQWGWRIPFLVGRRAGLRPAVVPGARSGVGRVVARDQGGPAAAQPQPRAAAPRSAPGAAGDDRAVAHERSVVSVMPRLLLTEYDLSAVAVTWVLLLANVLLFAAFVVVGVLSQVVGRRAVLVAGAAVAGTAGLSAYALVASGKPGGGLVVALVAAVHVLVVGAWGAASSYCNERFPTAVRSSGFGIGYSLSLVLPSLSAFYLAGLAMVMPFQYTQLVLLALGAGLLAWGASRGPETAAVDLTAPWDEPGSATVAVPAQRGPVSDPGAALER
jgi:MFS family permease